MLNMKIWKFGGGGTWKTIFFWGLVDFFVLSFEIGFVAKIKWEADAKFAQQKKNAEN